MLSDYIGNYVKGNDITNEELIHLRQQIEKAHQLHKTVRFWGTPDRPDVWKNSSI